MSLLFANGVEQYFTVPNPWAHQIRGVDRTLNMLESVQSCTLCSGTGSGKTVMAMALINKWASEGSRVSFYTNRKLLTHQSSLNFTRNSIDAGVRAASMLDKLDLEKSVQISSMQSEISWLKKHGQESLHQADYVVVDEAHMMATGGSLKVIKQHIEMGAKVVLLSATPIGLSHITPNLIIAAKNSELRKCGALVMAYVKCIHELDVSRVKRVKNDYHMGSFVEQCWSQAIVGHVYNDWKRFNPDGRMTLVFAPSVAESRAVAAHFESQGVTAAHLDAQEIYWNGQYIKDNAKGERRKELLAAWRNGNPRVLVNYEVMREGLDVPELYHLVLLRPFGSLKDYIQVVGRVLRKSQATPDHVIITDHCGNYWQHGSPNQDIDWNEFYFLQEKEILEKQDRKRLERKEEEVAAVCPKCGTILKYGKCPPAPIGCGEEITVNNPRKLRFVYQQNGQLKEIDESELVRKPRKQNQTSPEQQAWNAIFWAARKSQDSRVSSRTFRSGRELYRQRTGKPLPSKLSLLPKYDEDWDRRIRDVDFVDLTRFNT